MLGSLMYGVNSFVLLMLVSRQAGVEAAGIFGIAFTNAQMLWIIGIFGASHYQLTDLHEAYPYAAYRWLKVFSSALMAVATLALGLIMPMDPAKAQTTVLLSVYMLSHVVSELYQSRMFQMNRLDLAGQSQFFRTLIPLLCFAALQYLGQSLQVATIGLAASGLICVWLFGYLPCRPYLGQSRTTNTAECKSLLLACLPLFISLLLMNLVIQLPKYVIDRLGSNEMQGIFNMIFMPAQVINMIAGFIYRPLIHRISEMLDQRDWQGFFRLLRSQALLVIGITAVGSLCAWFLGATVLGAFYGVQLQTQQVAITLVIVGGGIFAFDQLMYYVAVIMRCQRQILINYIVALTVGLLVCIPLVRASGIIGAVIAFMVIHTGLFIGYVILILNKRKERKHA
jgi:O-antigen/teichoic acid export membrane protein